MIQFSLLKSLSPKLSVASPKVILDLQAPPPPIGTSMSPNQPANFTPGPASMDNSLEAQLRGMILTNSPSESPRKHPLVVGPPRVSGSSPYPAASGLSPMSSPCSNLPPVSHGLPSPDLVFPGGSFANVSAPSVAYQTYPGSHSGLPSSLQTTNLPPSQHPDPQPKTLNMFPSTPTRSDKAPKMRHQYGSPQQNTPPRQRPQPPQMTAGRQLRTSPNGQHVSRAPTLGHFSPLGTQPANAKTPPQNPYQQQQPMAQMPQPLPIHTRSIHPPSVRGSGPVRGNFRGYTRRMPQQPIEQISVEQSHYLNELSKQVIAEAAPPESEISIKHALLKRLKAICKDMSPDAKLIPFGSLVTGFATANSDLDVIFTGWTQADILEDPDDSSSDFGIPMLLESKLLSEGFNATLLTKTRVPILKLVQKATEESPYELQCDIGFSNLLAIYNTQMLLTYSKCDPRVKQMMIFIKWWAKKRHINNPYRGTLSSYGYALIVLHYLINVVRPPVLQNLQNISIPNETSEDEIVFEGDFGDLFEIWFYKDIEQLPKSNNNMHMGELLRGFFEYYANTFQWGREVVSIRTKGGLLTKQQKGWVAAVIRPGRVENSEVKDRYLFAVEDPFETEHNVSRTCNGPGVMRMREEFRRAVRLVRYRDGGKTLFECLCMEAPPERPWVRREDRDKDRQRGGDGEAQNLGGADGNGERHEVEQARGGASESTREHPDVGEVSTEALRYCGPVTG